MKSKVLLPAIAVCLCVNISASAKADTWQPSPQIKMAVAGMKNAVANVKYMRARVIYTNHLPTQFTDLMDAIQKDNPKMPQGKTANSYIARNNILWQIAGADVYLRTQRYVVGDANSTTMITWEKNNTIYQLTSQWEQRTEEDKKRIYYDGWIGQVAKTKIRGNLFYSDLKETPLMLAFNNALADSFLQKKNNATFKGYNNIDGNKCMKIETHPAKDALYTWWIDVNHGFLIYRSEQITKFDDITSKAVSQASHLVKYGKTWLPQKIETKIDVNDEVKLLREKNPTVLPPSLKDASAVVPPLVQEYTIQDVSIGDKKIPPVIWPLGTSLSFNDPNNAFTITAVTEKELAQLNLNRKTRSLPALREYPIGAHKPGTIGVALSNAEIKQLKKWRANDMQ